MPTADRHDLLVALAADVERALNDSSSLSVMLQACAESLVRNLDLAFARVWTLDSALDVLILQASAGHYTHLDGSHSRISVGAFKIGRIAQQRSAHLTNDVLNDPAVDREWARREGMIAFAGYPLVVDDKLVGVFGTFARHSLSDSVIEALRLVAQSIANAIAGRLLDEKVAS